MHMATTVGWPWARQTRCGPTVLPCRQSNRGPLGSGRARLQASQGLALPCMVLPPPKPATTRSSAPPCPPADCFHPALPQKLPKSRTQCPTSRPAQRSALLASYLAAAPAPTSNVPRAFALVSWAPRQSPSPGGSAGLLLRPWERRCPPPPLLLSGYPHCFLDVPGSTAGGQVGTLFPDNWLPCNLLELIFCI